MSEKKKKGFGHPYDVIHYLSTAREEGLKPMRDKAQEYLGKATGYLMIELLLKQYINKLSETCLNSENRNSHGNNVDCELRVQSSIEEYWSSK